MIAECRLHDVFAFQAVDSTQMTQEVAFLVYENQRGNKELKMLVKPFKKTKADLEKLKSLLSDWPLEQ